MSVETAAYRATHQRQIRAANVEMVRQRLQEVMAQRSDDDIQGASNTADLLEMGHFPKRTTAGAAALLLDVLA